MTTGAELPPRRPWSTLRRALDRTLAFLLRIRTRLLVINLIAVLVPVVGIGWARTFEREGLRALELDMRHVAESLRTILERNLDADRRPQLQVLAPALEVLAQRTRMRVRVLDRRGQVIADSHLGGPPEGPEPPRPALFGERQQPPRRHAADQPSTDPGPIDRRAEIQAALRGQLGTATRVHERIQRVFLFLALPVMVDRRVQSVVYITRCTLPVLTSLHRLRTSLLHVLAVALAATAIMTLFLSFTISRPLGRLSRTARRMAAGERGATLRLDRRDEIGELSRSFDALRRKLDARAQDKSELMANISHELKTPLASINGAAELLLDDLSMTPEARERFLSNILADTDRLSRMVSRLLELSRVEAEVERRAPVDLVELLAALVSERPDAPLRVSAPRSLRIAGDRAHLLSALRALTDNALRYSPPGEAVELTLERRDDAAALRVTDRGPGISPAHQHRIFERFFTTEAHRGGTGLGLSIVAAVTRAHGGSVAVESSPGQGTTIELRLPRRPARG